MILWAEHFGFLLADRKMDEAKGQKMGSRWDEAMKAGRDPPMPPILEGRFLITALRDMGFASSNGFGLVPLSFTEIEAYGRATGGLTPSEVRLLRRMSGAYCSGRNRGTDVFEVPPWPLRDEEGEAIPDDDPELRDWEADDGGYF